MIYHETLLLQYTLPYNDKLNTDTQKPINKLPQCNNSLEKKKMSKRKIKTHFNPKKS